MKFFKVSCFDSDLELVSIETYQSTKGNLKYFFIYQIYGKEINGDVRTIYRCLERHSAEDHLKFARHTYENLYSSMWISEEIVWL